jgi:hypothetical protein
VEWGGPSALTARDILKDPANPEQRSALSVAKEFLAQELAEGSVAAEEVKEDACGAGVSERTLERAKRELGVGSRKRGGVWYWVPAQEEPEEVHSPAVGTLGTVGTLDKDAKNEPANYAYLRKGGQGCQEGQGDQEPRCIHEFPGGRGCYLCDPNHPHRRRQEARR